MSEYFRFESITIYGIVRHYVQLRIIADYKALSGLVMLLRAILTQLRAESKATMRLDASESAYCYCLLGVAMLKLRGGAYNIALLNV